MKDNKYDAVQQADKSSKSCVSILWMSCSAICWGIFIGIIVNGFMWFDRGYDQLMLDLQENYKQQYSILTLRNINSASYLYSCIEIISSHCNSLWVYAKELFNQVPYIGLISESESVQGFYQDVTHAIGNFFNIFGMTCKLVLGKFFNLLASVQFFIFTSILGAMDGLLTRYIRTVEGGRESTFIFHRISSSVIKFPFAMLFLYLASPFYFDPEIMVIILGLLFFTFFYITTANLKKFL